VIAVGETLFVSLVGVLMVAFSINVSRNLHKGMLAALMRAPMSFFDATPTGRITNRNHNNNHSIYCDNNGCFLFPSH
jgi:ABC-type multidrug transport system fused ATPase/permease subunit